jgi:putative peptide zinc metalloprotease protein
MTKGVMVSEGLKAAPRTPLPALREDLRLYPGPTHRDGSPGWRIHDPVRNAFFDIGWLEFELLSRWKDHRNAESLVADVAAHAPLQPTLAEAGELIEFLAANQLLAPGSDVARETLGRRLKSSRVAWHQQLLHHYLFFRLPLFRPDTFLARTVGLTDIFFTRGFVVFVLGLLCVDLYLLSREWYSFTDAMSRMLTPAAFLYYAVALSFAKVIHELGHAYAARRYGVRVPTMGVAFLVMWPVLYTDTGETWKLGDRRKQLIIASAGMAAELVLAVFSTLLWALSPEGAAKNVFFVLASTSWVMTLAVNLSPFMRFDGYFVLSDALDFPNLHERGGACARWWLRKTFFGLAEPTPEPDLLPRQRAGLILFAYITWAYRLTVFLGIAAMVYFMFWKLLGLFLFLVEILWFVVKPVWREVAYLWKARAYLRFAWRPLGAVALVVFALLWIVPVASVVTAPAILRAQHEHAVYAPFGAKVVEVLVRDSDYVAEGMELVRLDIPDVEIREKKADIAMISAQTELARSPASRGQQENVNVLQQRVAQAMAEKQSVADDRQRQVLRSSQDGTVRDMQADLVPGRWINSRQLLMRVVSQTEPVIEVFVDQRQVAAIREGQTVRFFPHQADRPVLKGLVIGVERTPQKELARPLLASVNGGDVMVKKSPHGALVPQDAIFRIAVKPVGDLPRADSVIHGSVRIDTGIRFLAENFAYRVISLLIRESGI